VKQPPLTEEDVVAKACDMLKALVDAHRLECSLSDDRCPYAPSIIAFLCYTLDVRGEQFQMVFDDLHDYDRKARALHARDN
jgi:hypothetical protein